VPSFTSNDVVDAVPTGFLPATATVDAVVVVADARTVGQVCTQKRNEHEWRSGGS
jgi:hypothetical protein